MTAFEAGPMDAVNAIEWVYSNWHRLIGAIRQEKNRRAFESLRGEWIVYSVFL